MPGSRFGEIRNNLAVMNLALNQYPQYRGVIIGAPGIDDEVYKACGAGMLPLLRVESAVDVLAHCRAALVTSGTATLETALVGVPQVALYRGNGTKITYEVMKTCARHRFRNSSQSYCRPGNYSRNAHALLLSVARG